MAIRSKNKRVLVLQITLGSFVLVAAAILAYILVPRANSAPSRSHVRVATNVASLPIAKERTNRELVEIAVSSIVKDDDPASRATGLARAAALSRHWDRVRARELGEAAVRDLRALKSTRPASPPEDEFTAQIEQLKQVVSQSEVAASLLKVDPKLASSMRDLMNSREARLALDREVLLASRRGTKPPLGATTTVNVSFEQAADLLALHIKQSVSSHFSSPSSFEETVELLMQALSRPRKSKSSRGEKWSQLQPAVDSARRIKDPAQRAEMLVLFSAVARRLGRNQEWTLNLRPSVLAALASITYPTDRMRAFAQCIKTARSIDVPLAHELLDDARADLARQKLPAAMRNHYLISPLTEIEPEQALALAARQPDLSAKALDLTYLELHCPAGHPSTLNRGRAMALSLLRSKGSSLKPAYVQLLLPQVAKSFPDEALAIAEREGKRAGRQQHFLFQVLMSAAKANPDWTLSHATRLRNPTQRATVVLTAVAKRIGEPDSAF